MRNILLLFAFTCSVYAQGDLFSKPPVPGKKLWLASIATFSTANALDVHSSWGKHELNGRLAGPDGRFGRDGALIKLALEGGVVGFEYLITRRHPSPKLLRALAWINFGGSAGVAAVAAHNYSVPR